MSTASKFFHSGMPGAPVMGFSAGSLLSVLDACLRTGFGQVNVTALVVADGIATATVASHSAVPYCVVLIEGVTGPMASFLNGEQRVNTTSGSTVTFPTSAADGAATGSMTLKIAPLGWERTFTGPNKAAFRSLAPEASGFFLRVDDTGTQTARVVGYEAMTDVDTGVRAFPNETQRAGGFFWGKQLVDYVPSKWAVFGDEKIIYYCVDALSTPGTWGDRFHVTSFGDPVGYSSTDAFCTILTGSDTSGSALSGDTGAGRVDMTYASAPGLLYAARSHSGLGDPLSIFVVGACSRGSNATSGASGYGWGAYPNEVDGSLLLTDVLGVTTGGYRFALPAIKHAIQNVKAVTPFPFTAFQVVAGTGNMLGLPVMMIPIGNTNAGANEGVVAFDITGRWR